MTVPDNNLMNNQNFLLVIFLILLLQLRQRKIRSWKLIITPVLISLITIPLIYSEISSAFNALVILLGLLIGLLMGILIGKFMEVKIDKNGTIVLKGSLIAVFMWIAIILLKIYGKNALNGTGFIKLDVLTSAFLIMTLGAMISRRMFIYWKYLNHKKLVDTSKKTDN